MCKEKYYVVSATRNNQHSISDCATVSQFTLLASTKKGNKPDFHGSAGPDIAKQLYDCFFDKVASLYGAARVKNGVFQAMMDVSLVNDGPVSLNL